MVWLEVHIFVFGPTVSPFTVAAASNAINTLCSVIIDIGFVVLRDEFEHNVYLY